jgi:hypothetical protein
MMDGDEAELRGSIQSINGTVPDLMLMVAGPDRSVAGRRRADGVLLAQKITLEDDGDEGREGADRIHIRPLGGERLPVDHVCPAGRIDLHDEATEFDDVRCSALTNGQRVEAKGFREASGTVRARRVRSRT